MNHSYLKYRFKKKSLLNCYSVVLLPENVTFAFFPLCKVVQMCPCVIYKYIYIYKRTRPTPTHKHTLVQTSQFTLLMCLRAPECESLVSYRSSSGLRTCTNSHTIKNCTRIHKYFQFIFFDNSSKPYHESWQSLSFSHSRSFSPFLSPSNLLTLFHSSITLTRLHTRADWEADLDSL